MTFTLHGVACTSFVAELFRFCNVYSHGRERESLQISSNCRDAALAGRSRVPPSLQYLPLFLSLTFFSRNKSEYTAQESGMAKSPNGTVPFVSTSHTPNERTAADMAIALTAKGITCDFSPAYPRKKREVGGKTKRCTGLWAPASAGYSYPSFRSRAQMPFHTLAGATYTGNRVLLSRNEPREG